MKNFKKVFFLRFYGTLVAIVSIMYGLKLIISPEILEQYKTYAVISSVFNNPFLAYAFVLFGILKIIGIIINNKTVKVAAIFGLFFLWTMFTISFFIMDIYYDFPTSLGILCLTPMLISGRVALSEV